MRRTRQAIGFLILSTSLLVSCHRSEPQSAQSPVIDKIPPAGVLNLFWWSDFMASDTVSNFEKETGIKVNVSYYDSEETLETRMLTGNSGYDVVDPAAPYFFQRQIRSGAYLALDKSKLPNLAHMDPAIMARIAQVDPDNAHGTVYTWGTIGIGYNPDKVALVLPHAAMNSWRVIFDPTSASQLAKCGIQLLDSPAEVVTLVLRYLGKNPDSTAPEDFEAVSKILMAIRPYVRNIDTSSYLEAIANGDVCVVVGYNGDFIQARRRATAAKNGVQIAYSMPDEGSLVYFNIVAIPRDAPHPDNAHRFLNYLMRPQVITEITNFVGYPNANTDALPLIETAIAKDTTTYPTPAQRARLFVRTEDTPEQARVITRLWQKFKAGQ